ncbi:isochorismatase family protein [Saccharothrix obliqua]|uniref:isochorismatase family protein n=1 Tax=Saccharothrix obliqua TaxID=2861747 RepID=UPI001C5DC9D6|nr:isochorismatase family protein [Saccharothrix obliqua]MBW4716870.1 isochorismatase family protein [Saccharothrix obliqua]
MGLPTIEPYPMPTAADLPVNRVKWVCAPSRAVLLIHDMQNHFLRAFDPDASPVVELVENIRALRQTCHALGIPVVYSAQPGGQSTEQRGLQLDMWGTGIGTDPHDAEIVDALAPGAGDVRMTKWRYNAFHRTDLRSLLDSSGRDQLVVTGIYAHIGCLMTAADAFMQDIQAFFVADAVADFSADDHHMAVRYAAGRCAVTTTTTRLITELNGAA